MDPDEVRQGRAALGRRLAMLREAAGYTQHTFAPLTHYGRSTIANVETGGQRAPREFWQRCDDLLGTDGALTAHYDELEVLVRRARAQQAQRRNPNRPAATTVGSAGEVGFPSQPGDAYVGVERSIVGAARETSEHAMDAGAWAVSDVTVEQLRDDAMQIARDYAQLTPALAVTETLRVRDLAVRLLERTRRPAQLHELYLITAQAAGLLASASIDLGLWPSAMQYARAAYTYGEVVGHDGARAYARGLQATIAYWIGRPRQAVEYAEAAIALAPPGVAQVRASCVLARAWSHQGSEEGVRRAIAAADDARHQHGEDPLHDVIGGEFGFSPTQQARCGSTAWLQVGRVQEATAAAVASLELAAAHRSEPWSTVEAEARVDLASCRILAGEIDAAEDVLTPLWSIPSDWRRAGLIGRLRTMRDLLADARWRQVAVARHMTEQVESFAATRPERPALPPT